MYGRLCRVGDDLRAFRGDLDQVSEVAGSFGGDLGKLQEVQRL